MSQCGVHCVRGYIDHDDCRKCSADPLHPCGLTPDVLEGMREDPNSRHADPDAFSPSMLLDCDRRAALTMGHDWYIDIESGWKMLRGTMVHALIQDYRYPGAVGVIRETEMETTIQTAYGPQRMTGQPDVVVVKRLYHNGEGLHAVVGIIDYKSTGEIGHDLVEAKRDHQRQINFYAWLVRRWLPEHYHAEKMTVEVDEITIQYLDFKKFRRFTSAGPLQAKGKRLNRSAPYQYETLDLAPLVLYPDDVVEANIRLMIEAKLEARETLPPAYEPGDEDYWRCMFCPVREMCGELTERGI